MNRGQPRYCSRDGDRVDSRHRHRVSVARAKLREIDVPAGRTGRVDVGDRTVWLSDECNEVTAESRVVGIHDREDERRRQGGVDGVTASSHDVGRGFSGERVWCGDGAVPTR